MSRVTEAKKTQGYQARPVKAVCMNCLHYTSETENKTSAWGTAYSVEKNIRCGIGRFAVMKLVTCDLVDISNVIAS